MVISKARAIPIILGNTNRVNVWVRQPLLAVEFYDVRCDQTEYRTTVAQGRNNLRLGSNLYLPVLLTSILSGGGRADSPLKSRNL